MATCVRLVRSQRKVAKMFLLYSPHFVCLRVRHKHRMRHKYRVRHKYRMRHKYRVPEPIFMKFGVAEFLDLMQL
jgi:hypothetical protein